MNDIDDIDEFLRDYSPGMAATANELRRLVLRAVPDAVERLRPGWRLIGFDVPNGRRLAYFAWVWPQPDHDHVHVGWQTGTLMNDANGVLQGADLKLKKVRYLTFQPGGKVDAALVTRFTHEAARIASLSRAERELIAISRDGLVGDG
jgi:hypothetical protein